VALVRRLLERVQKLEQVRISPFALVATPEFEAEIRADVESGKLDRIDMVGADGNSGVLGAILAWHEQGLFGLWQRDRIWGYAGERG
jgi:hypothetical protein